MVDQVVSETISASGNKQVIDKPEAGQTVVLDVNNDSRVAFSFDLSTAKVELHDIDLVVTFPDGSSIVLVGFALRLVDEKSVVLSFDGKMLSGQELMSRVGDFIASDSSSKDFGTVSAVNGDASKQKSTETEGASPQVEIIEVQAEPNKRKADYEKKSSKSDDSETTDTAPADFILASRKQYDQPPSSSASGARSEPKNLNTSMLEVPVPGIEAKLFGIGDAQMSDSGLTRRIAGALATGAAENNISFAAQSARDAITGTSGTDVIHVDDPKYAGYGTTTRVIELTTSMPDTTWQVEGMRIIGLPAGFSVIDSEMENGGYTLDIDPNNPLLTRLNLQYILPDDAKTADANGFYSFFTLKVEYTITSTISAGKGVTVGTVNFGIRDVGSEADMSYLDPVTNLPFYVLWSRPPGSVVDAGGGDDTVVAGAGFDNLNGGSGSDTLSYSQSHSSVSVNLASRVTSGGYAEGDVILNFENLEGSRHDDSLVGDAFDNIITGGLGADEIAGGDGKDTSDYSGSTAAVEVNLATGTGVGGEAEGDTLTSVERLIGSRFSDTLQAGLLASTLEGGEGNDTLIAGGDTDFLDGGDGEDTASFENSDFGVTIDLTLEDPQISNGDASGDTLISIENLIGSSHNDSLKGNDGANQIEGGDGNDMLDGGAGADVLNGGDGTDTVTYVGSDAAVTVNLQNGTGVGGTADGDRLVLIENITGSGFNDALTGNSLANTLLGGIGNDLLIGLGGADRLDGGAGDNTVDYSASLAGVSVNLSSASVTSGAGPVIAAGKGVGGDAEGDTLIAIRNLVGSARNDFFVANVLGGKLEGQAGNDIFIAGAGTDTLQGGGGIDTVIYTGSNAGVIIDLAENTASGGFATNDILRDVEHITGSSHADTLSGNSLDNVINGEDSDDRIEGGNGADRLDGGADADTVLYTRSTVGVTVDLTLLTAQVSEGDANGDILSNFENITGSDHDDTLTGDGTVNVLIGGLGDDILRGLGGGDVLDGGEGNDMVSYAGSDTAVTVDLETESASGGDADDDTLISIEGVIGSSFDDTLSGSVSDNIIRGGAGNDSISGSAGNDTLDGGDGIDTADFSEAESAVTLNLATEAGLDASDGTFILLDIENLIGSEFNDVLTGSDADNVIDGGAGNDILMGGAGADALSGGGGVDTASYTTSNQAVSVNLGSKAFTDRYSRSVAAGNGAGGDAQGDILVGIRNLVGSDFNDWLVGSVLGGRLDGGKGHDQIIRSGSANTILGGDGNDTVSYINETKSFVIDLAKGRATASGMTDTIDQVEDVIGTNYADTITGDSGSNRLLGQGGNDHIEGGDGNDFIDGGTGTDFARYDNAKSAVYVRGTGTFNTVGAGTDTLTRMEGIYGSKLSDIIIAESAINSVFAGTGNDYVQVRKDSVQVDGGAGTDTIAWDTGLRKGGVNVDLALNSSSGRRAAGSAWGSYFTGFENVVGTVYNDYIAGDNNKNALMGGAGNDLLKGGGGDDILSGGTGDDTLAGGTGADTLIGGDGNDTVTYQGSSAGVNANLSAGIATGGDAGSEAIAAYSNANLVAGWSFATVTGSTINSVIGTTIPITLLNTTSLTGGLANHGNALEFHGGTSNDTARIGNMTLGDAFSISTWVNFDTMTGAAGIWSLASTGSQRLTLRRGSDGSLDFIVAGTTSTGTGSVSVSIPPEQVLAEEWMHIVCTYRAGRIEIYKNGTLMDFAQSTVILSALSTFDNNSLGDDPFSDLTFDGKIDDFAIFNTAITEAEVQQLYTQTKGLENSANGTDTFSDIENLVGSSHNDTLTGDDKANILDGGEGNDILSGASGNDTLIGGLGSDVLDGGEGIDTASYASSTTAVTVNLETNTSNDGDTLVNIENVIGSVNNDTITGNAGDNLLVGGLGDDVIEGGEGNDKLYGDSEADSRIDVKSSANLLVNGDFENYTTNRGTGTWVATGSGATGWQIPGTATAINIWDTVEIPTDAPENQAVVFGFGRTTDLWQNIATVAGQTYTIQFSLSRFGANTQVQVLYNDVVIGVPAYVPGNETFNWTNYTYTVVGTGGIDKLQFMASGSNFAQLDNIVFAASGGNDEINGGTGDDEILAGAGNDTIAGGSGTNEIDGGGGNDTAVFGGNREDYTITYDESTLTFTLTGADSEDSVKDVETFRFANSTVTRASLMDEIGFNLTSVGIAENSAPGSNAGVLMMVRDQVVTFTITGGAHSDLFVLDGETIRLADGAHLNFESASTYSVEVTATLADGSTYTKVVEISVTNVNEAPVITSNGGGDTGSISMSENQTAIAIVGATDEDSGAAKTYSISGGPDQSKFTIDLETGILTFISAPSYESPEDVDGNNVYIVDVMVSDGSLTDVQRIEITVTDDNDAPTITSAIAVSVSENRTSVMTVTATDDDEGTSLSFSIVGGDDFDRFSIDPVTGVLSFLSAADYENPTDEGANNVYDVQIQVTDGTHTDVKNIAVTVVNEAPLITSSTSFTIQENTYSVATMASSDAGYGARTWSISGTDAALFAINALSGELSFLAGPDYERARDAGADNVYDITLSVSDGLLSSSQNITISVTNDADETVNGTSAADILYGGPGYDTIAGGEGDDQLFGEDGDDAFVGGAGADTHSGGDGNDSVTYASSGTGVTVDLRSGMVGIGGDAAGDTYDSIENVTGTSGNDILTGNAEANILSGGVGDDVLDGGTGLDFLSGGDGIDVFHTDGDDEIDGGAGVDTVVFSGSGNIILTGIFEVETLDFRNSESNTAEITSSLLTNLAPQGDILTINRDATDSITLSGATDMDEQVIESGITYDVFTMLDDASHEITIHYQAA